LNTFLDLKNAIVLYVRTDEIIPSLPTFISLAEANIMRALNNITALYKSATLTLSIGNQYAEMLGVNTIKEVSLSGEPLSRKTFVLTDSDEYGSPYEYTIEGKNILKVFPTPDEAYQLDVIYTPVLSPLLEGGVVEDTSTNWLLQEAPDVYLYACLAVVGAYLNSEEVSKWAAMYKEAVSSFRSMHTEQSRIEPL
jgi:hypothetical protein